ATSREIGGRLLRRNGLPESVARAVEGEAIANNPSMNVKVTGIARRAASVILQVGKGGDPSALAARVGELRDELAIAVPPETVVETCLQAAGAALAALRSAR